MKIASTPYDFPLNGGIEPQNCALMVIDMQVDFCASGGFMDGMGVDLTPLRAPIGPIGRILTVMRDGGFTVVHTRETFQPDLIDMQPHRRYRGVGGEAIIPGDRGPLGRCRDPGVGNRKFRCRFHARRRKSKRLIALDHTQGELFDL